MTDEDEIFRVWRDAKPPGTAAGQMAVDEALFRKSETPVIRIYRWAAPAVTIGHFIKSEAAVAEANPGRDIARRRTGGGIVEHGDDVTFALVVPRRSAPAETPLGSLLRSPAPERYRWIHERLAEALRGCGVSAETTTAASSGRRVTGLGRCFDEPVVSDVIDPDTGRKIAGGAQRRSREGWLHQGSVRLDAPHDRIDAAWTHAFCEGLSGSARLVEIRSCDIEPADAVQSN